MNYADPFGIQETTPLSRALRRIELRQNTRLNWPAGYLGPDYLASINQVRPSSENLSLVLPNALGASEGTGFLMVNVGAFPFDVRDFTDMLITSVSPGEAKYIYCDQNLDPAGSWHSVTFGVGNSEADALALAGLGLTSIDGKLGVGFNISTTASNVLVSESHRGRIIVNNGGSININLPQYDKVGNGFFFAVHNGGSGTVNILPASGNKVDDFDSLALAPNESIFVCCSGTFKWYTIGYGRSTQFQFTKLVKDVSAGGVIPLTSAEASNKLLQFIGQPDQNVIVVLPSVVGIYYVQNTYDGPNSLTLKTQSGNGLALSSSDRAIVYCDGVNVVSAQSVAVGINISVVDGSLGTPSISFSSDPNSGLYKADLDTVGIVSNGEEAARFHNDQSSVAGQFGIGVVDPIVQLHVVSPQSESVRVQAPADPMLTMYIGAVRAGYLGALAKETVLGQDAADGSVSFFVGGARKASVSATGLRVFGSIVDAANNPFATLGSNTFTGIQVMPVQRGKLIPVSVVSGVATVDTSTGNSFSMTVTGPTRIDFTGKPAAGQDQTIYLKIRNGGTNVTYGTMFQYPDGGLKPTLTTTGVDLLAAWYDADLDCFVIGRAYKDYHA